MYKNIKFLEKNDVTAIAYENLRKRLIDKGLFRLALKSYSRQRLFLFDDNSSSFWDSQFEDRKKEFPLEKWRIKKVLSQIDLKKSILNIGVGAGFLENIFFKKNPDIKYVGTDITNDSLNRMSSRYKNINFVHAKIQNLPFLDGTFDQVVLLEVLEHIKPSETFRSLSEVFRVLKSGGKFIISVPVNEGLEEMLPNNPNSHMRFYSKDLILFELRRTGFIVRKIHYASAFSSFFYLKNLINQIFFLRESNNLILVCQK